MGLQEAFRRGMFLEEGLEACGVTGGGSECRELGRLLLARRVQGFRLVAVGHGLDVRLSHIFRLHGFTGARDALHGDQTHVNGRVHQTIGQ